MAVCRDNDNVCETAFAGFSALSSAILETQSGFKISRKTAKQAEDGRTAYSHF
ncbi:hypothetical protein [Lacticaseibacillus sp. GG6-2]